VDVLTWRCLIGVIARIVLGAVAGLIAERLTGSRTGVAIATAVGIVGALLGGFMAKVLFKVHSLNTFSNLRAWVDRAMRGVFSLGPNRHGNELPTPGRRPAAVGSTLQQLSHPSGLTHPVHGCQPAARSRGQCLSH